MHNCHRIFIGSKLAALPGTMGEYAVQFMSATLTFDNGSSAVDVYKKIEGEAYLWDVSQEKKAVLIEAKLIDEVSVE